MIWQATPYLFRGGMLVGPWTEEDAYAFVERVTELYELEHPQAEETDRDE